MSQELTLEIKVYHTVVVRENILGSIPEERDISKRNFSIYI